METAGDIIKDALIELTVQAQEQTIPAVDLNTGIRYLNRMMAAFDADGIQLGYTIVKSPNDKLTVPAGAYEGMMYNLCLRLANGYDIAVSGELAMIARQSKSTLTKLGVDLPKQNFPSTLPIGSGNDHGNGYLYGQTFFDGCCEDTDQCEDI